MSSFLGWAGASVGSKGRVGEPGSVPDASASTTGQEHTRQKRGSNPDGSKMLSNLHSFSLWRGSTVCVGRRTALPPSKSMCGS